MDEVNTFQEEVKAYKSRLLLIYNLASIASTLLFIWLIYSQICVILSQWRGIRKGGSDEDGSESELGSGDDDPAALDPGDEAEVNSDEDDMESAADEPVALDPGDEAEVSSDETSSDETSSVDVDTTAADTPETDDAEEQANALPTDDGSNEVTESP